MADTFLGNVCRRGHGKARGVCRRYTTNYHCVKCVRDYTKKRDEANRQKRAQRGTVLFLGALCKRGHTAGSFRRSWRYVTTRQCAACLLVLNNRYYEENPEVRRKSSRQSYWKTRDKCLIRMRKYRKTAAFRRSTEKYRFVNRERRLAMTRAWRKTPRGRSVVHIDSLKRRGRIKVASSGVEPYTIEQLLQRLAEFRSRCAYCPKPATTYDHVLALASGGKHTIRNIVPACRPCNCKKSDKDVVKWFKRQPTYTPARMRKIRAALRLAP